MYYTQKFIQKRFSFSRQQMWYWRHKGLLTQKIKRGQGQHRYTFEDLRVLKVIKSLRDQGISTRRIRESFESLKSKFKRVKNPFLKGQIIVTGKKLIFIHEGKVYEAISGQMILLDYSEVNRWVEKVTSINKEEDVTDDEFNFYKQPNLEVK